MRILLLCFYLTVLGLCPDTTVAQSSGDNAEAITNAIVALENTTGIDGQLYCCEATVHAVNCLRHLGKEGALKALQQHFIETGSVPMSEESDKILMLCRLLFVNPNGWKQPRLGQADPDVDRHNSEKFPLFPIALSHGVPFLLISGYNAFGYSGDTADKCLKLCEGFDLITNDLPEQGYEEAGRLLVKSEELRTLYSNTNVLPYVEKTIFEQALCSDPIKHPRITATGSIEIKTWSVPQTNN